MSESHSAYKIVGETIAASWDKHQGEKLKELFREIKKNPRLAPLFVERLRTRSMSMSLCAKKIGITTNSPTDDGLQRHAKLIVGESTDYFTHFAVGSGTTAPTPADKTLEAEIDRVDMESDDGWRVSGGTAIIEAGIFDETYPTFTASECAVFDGDGSDPNNEVMEWRSVYPTTQQVTHTQNVNLVTHIHTMFMIPT